MIVVLVTLAIVALAVAGGAPRAQAAASTSPASTAVTVTAAQQDPDVAGSPFPNLSVTVSQTQDLTSQGLRLTFSGGTQSTIPNNQVAGADFLQFMQCWGDLKDASGALVLDQNGQPQPDRTTCQYGSSGLPGQSRNASQASVDLFAAEDAPYVYPGSGWWDPPQASIPFRSVTGKVLQRIAGGRVVSTDDIDNNEFFTKLTTNEVPWAGFGASGAGSTTFEVQTNAQAPGLGCGSAVSGAAGAVTGQPCWLVVVPRGAHDLGSSFVDKSALLWGTWKHRLAVKLGFKPLGARCAIGAAERSLGGSELMTTAVASWQPKLCTGTGGSIYNLLVANEGDQLATANGTAAAALALTSRPLDAAPGDDRMTYAPVAVSGIALAFAIDHQADVLTGAVPPDVKALDHQPITQMNLTPRLLAKLLTSSYKSALPLGADLKELGSNPENITKDPDFLAINDPMWAYQSLSSSAIAGAFVPFGRSDSAWAVWSYILSDPEGVDFLAGKPDPWGMVVNPYSATDAAKNPTGVAATYPVLSFPKADPVESDIAHTGSNASVVNLVTWRPFATDLDTSGYWVLRGDGKVLGAWDSIAVPPKYTTSDRDRVGSQRVIGLTSTAAAAKYQVFTAALRNPAGQFVTPTSASMSAAADAMSAVPSQPQVRTLDYASAAVKAASGAYPLTVPVYAATNAAGGDAPTRAAYASFIRYAAGAGQTPGTNDGQLPAGYAPLPATWAAVAAADADTIAAGPVTTPTSTPSPTSSTPSPATSNPSPASAAAVVVSRAAASTSAAVDAPAAGSTGSLAPSDSPTASGQASGPVVGPATPHDPDVGALRAAMPVGAAGGLLAALGVPLVSRIRRRP